MGRRIAILGASHGGQAVAAVLAMQGCEVALYEHPDFKANVEAIQARGGEIELVGALTGVGRVSLATCDIQAALAGAEIVLVIVPSFAQKIMLSLAAPHLRAGQTLILLPGNFGSIEARSLFKELGVDPSIRIAETSTIPYACRQIEAGIVDIFGVKTFMEVAALPADETEGVIADLQAILPIELIPAENVLAIGFSNFNMLVHSPTTVLNAGWIETTGGNFDFYGEGISPSVCRVLDTMDAERIEIGGKLKLDLASFSTWFQRAYPLDRPVESLFEVIQASKIHSGKGANAPKSLHERYITEDVPYLLVPVASFGRLVGEPAKVIEMIIGLASVMNSTDYMAEGRNLDRLGLSSLNVGEILAYVAGEISVAQ